jgi:beta-phosphoglucomutase-like phosphatase (HAD superfamily)
MSNNMSNTKAFIFDLDGTAYNSEEVKQRILGRLYEAAGLHAGNVNAGSIAVQTPMAAFASAKKRELDESEIDLWLAYSEQVTLKPGFLDLCHWAKAEGLKVGAASNGYRRRAEWTLNRLGAGEVFDCLMVIDDLPRGTEQAKPAPDLYQMAMTELGVMPDEVIAFEDSPTGAEAALAAEIGTVIVVPTTLTCDCTFPEGVFIYDSLTDLFPMSEFFRSL